MKHCIGCKHISSNKCGTIVKVRGSSGAVNYNKVPSNNCVINKRQKPSSELLHRIIGWEYVTNI
jgi:hypothetical protein